MGTPGIRFSLTSRDIVRTLSKAVGIHNVDAFVISVAVSKNMPGSMIAIANMDILRLAYGGTIASG